MPFHKGHKKIGGRGKGTPNRPKFDFWAKLTTMNWDITTQLMRTLEKCDPNTQAKVLLEMHKFVYPQAKAPEEETPEALTDEELLVEMKSAVQALEDKRASDDK
jgi:hypothetical protein